METSELIKKVRKIEIKTRGLSANIFAGEYHSAFKGRGMTFSEVREYQYGDSVKDIDWNVTARYNKPFIKIFEEERELTVILMIDVSGSSNFGTKSMLKRELITEISAVLAFSAIQNKDKIGVLFFSDKVEKFIPPSKGQTHILRIIRELINFVPQNLGTNITEALKFLTNVMKKKSIVFLISDFMDDNYKDAIKIANKRHDLVGLNIYDRWENELPSIGLVKLKDAETGVETWVNTSDFTTREVFRRTREEKLKKMDETLTQAKIDYVSISTEQDYIKSLMTLFKKRL